MKHRGGFTLMEMLVVTAVVASGISLLTAFFVDAWMTSHRTLGRIDHDQIVPIIMKKWQAVLKLTDSDSWEALQHNEDEFKAGHVRVWQNGPRLFFESEGMTNALHLPSGATCRFSIETSDNMATCAVMNLTWPSEHLRSKETNFVRFVACGRRK
jgi:prepilin-type N-terminal cleavage/methylation domain-containing protein